jgi:hypothetical protein
MAGGPQAGQLCVRAIALAAVAPRAAAASRRRGARVSGTGWVYDDPFWWRGPYYGRWGRPFWGPPGFGFPPTPIYEREVALLIRDRKSGTPLYEARASNDGTSPGIYALLAAMFEAAMKDFPNGGINPRQVTTEISKQ